MRHGILAAARGKDGLVHSIFCALKMPLDSGLSRLRRVFGALNERRNKDGLWEQPGENTEGMSPSEHPSSRSLVGTSIVYHIMSYISTYFFTVPKYLITRNDLIQHRNGIKHVNIAPFMKDNLDF